MDPGAISITVHQGQDYRGTGRRASGDAQAGVALGDDAGARADGRAVAVAAVDDAVDHRAAAGRAEHLLLGHAAAQLAGAVADLADAGIGGRRVAGEAGRGQVLHRIHRAHRGRQCQEFQFHRWTSSGLPLNMNITFPYPLLSELAGDCGLFIKPKSSTSS